jgi:tetratricopeptide (TPR) repeat protein
VLEGGAQPSEKRVRVNVQLIDAESGGHLWAEDFDSDRTDLLRMQDEIVTRLARTLQVQLTEVEAARLERAHPVNPDAQELALRCAANDFRYSFSSRNAADTERLCEQALQVDDRNALALSILADHLATNANFVGSADRDFDLRRADEMVSRALTIDPNSADAHYAKAAVLNAQNRMSEAIAESRYSLTLNPSSVLGYNQLAISYLFLGEPEKTIELLERAAHLSPHDPLIFAWHHVEGTAYVMLKQDGLAIELLRKSVTENPDWPFSRAYLTAALALNGQEAEARESLARYLSLGLANAKTIAAFKASQSSDSPGYRGMRERLYEGLRKAGMPEQ